LHHDTHQLKRNDTPTDPRRSRQLVRDRTQRLVLIESVICTTA
jgi:hypothetical protein